MAVEGGGDGGGVEDGSGGGPVGLLAGRRTQAGWSEARLRWGGEDGSAWRTRAWLLRGGVERPGLVALGGGRRG